MLNHLLKIDEIDRFVLDYPHKSVGHSRIIKADCLKWLAKIPENSFHGIVTDPPYGLAEYDADQLEKRDKGRGGIGGFRQLLTVQSGHHFQDSRLSTSVRESVSPTFSKSGRDWL